MKPPKESGTGREHPGGIQERQAYYYIHRDLARISRCFADANHAGDTTISDWDAIGLQLS
jgi:hypothetical protein